MTSLAKHHWPVLAVVAALLGGCANHEVSRGREYELSGQHHLAYEEYLKAAQASPGDGAATAGLQRTAGEAATYWLQQAIEAGENEKWTRSAKCHLKALQIKPDEVASIWALRQIGEKHPPDLERAYEAMSAGGVGDELAALAAAQAKPKAPEPAAASPEKSKTTGETPAEPAPKAKAKDTPPPKDEPKDAPKAKAKTKDAPPPKPKAKAKPKPKPVKPLPAPTARYQRGSSKSDFIMIVRVSDDDDRYPEKAELQDGLAIEVKDTDDSPRDADLNVYLGRKRTAKLKNLPTDTVIRVVGRSGKRYEIVVIDIYDEDETVTIGLRLAR